MPLTKEKIRDIFRQTRKSGMIFPFDCKNGAAEDFSAALSEELSCYKLVPNIRRGVERYIRRTVPGYRVAENRGRDYNSELEEKIAIAENLGLIIQKHAGKFGDHEDILTYFAHMLLYGYYNMDNGAFLRKTGTTPGDQINQSKIRKFRENYDPFDIPKPQKDKVDSIITDIFSRNIPILLCENNILASYVTGNRKSLCIRIEEIAYPETGNFSTFGEPRAISDRNNKTENYGDGFIIRYPNKVLLREFLPEYYKPGLLHIIRLLIAHEMGHFILHWDYSDVETMAITDKRDGSPEQEHEATYFARLLLFQREYLYYEKNGRKGSFDEACEKWKKLIRYVYGTYGKRDEEWLNWVLTD